jgi:cation:H+ antiporter
MFVHWLTFFLSAAGIIVAGIRLATYGEALGRHLRIGQGWIGLIFLATLTSVPEMTATVTAASIGAPNIALGNAFGSNLFNVVIVAVMDVLLLVRRGQPRGPFLAKVRSYHVISGGLAVVLTAIAVVGIALGPQPTVLGVSPLSVLILIGYCVGVYLLFRAEKTEGVEDRAAEAGPSLAKAVVGFMLCGVVIVVSGVFLVRASKEISVLTSLSASFVGAILVAVVTSLPELATSIGALRIGARDMIVGNLFGSNMFNILTVFFADVSFRRGPIFANLAGGESDQLVVAGCGILLTTIAVVAIAVRSTRRVAGIGVDSACLLVAYLAATALIIGRGIQL